MWLALAAVVWGASLGERRLDRRAAETASPFAAIRYEAESRTLFMAFRSGHEYAYREVPPECAAGFQRCDDKGRFFNARIRGRYPFDRLFSPAGGPGKTGD
jgi:lysyl-tRNA synthetase class 2